MFQPKISKEEVNLLPVEEFSGKIHVIDSSKKLKKAFEILNSQQIVGLDTENLVFQNGLLAGLLA